jgi:hypothetical protein
VIARPRPEPDDGPEPERMTPGRLARRLHRLGVRLSQLQLELRTYAPYLPRDTIEPAHDQIRTAAARVVDLGTAVRVGQVYLIEDYLDNQHTPERPVLDAIEAAPAVKAAEAIAPQIAARTADDERWDQATDHHGSSSPFRRIDPAPPGFVQIVTGATEPVRVPPVHPAASPARAAAKRRKAKAVKGGVL